MLRAVGFKDGDFDKPLVGVANGHSTMNPCNAGIQPLVDRAMASLRHRGISATFHYVPLHSAPFGLASGFGDETLPVTERIAACLLRLPLHPLLSDNDVDRVVEAVRSLS